MLKTLVQKHKEEGSPALYNLGFTPSEDESESFAELHVAGFLDERTNSRWILTEAGRRAGKRRT